MLYFKHLINKFCFKVKSSTLFKFFFGCVFLFFFIPNAKAFSINGKYDLTYGQATQFYNYSNASYSSVSTLTTNYGTEYNVYYTGQVSTGTYGIGVRARFNEILIPNRWYMLVYAVANSGNSCGMPNNFQTQFMASTSIGGNNYAQDVRNYTVTNSMVYFDYDAFDVCAYSVVFRVTSTSYLALLPMNTSGSANYSWVYYGYYLEDLGSTDGVSNSSLNNSINNMNSNITTMNSNISTQSTNIQNKIDSAKNQAHSDHQDLMNQDHTYNNNASDTVPNSSDINSVLNKQNTLSSDLDLDVSTLDIQLNTNTNS